MLEKFDVLIYDLHSNNIEDIQFCIKCNYKY